MPSARQRAGEMFNMFTPAHVAKGKTEVKVQLVSVTPAPADYKAPFVGKINPIAERDHITINKSNTNKLIELLGDDYSEWTPAEMTLEVVQYDDFPPGFIVTAAKKKTGKAPW
jgi:hypothetical protein